MYGNSRLLHKYAWALRRTLKLSPTQKLFRELRKRQVQLNQMDALEIFGADGSRHTLDYFPLVRSLEIWELNEKYLPGLRRNFPGTPIKITDSFKELQNTPNTYDLLVADPPCQIIGQNREYCEHFELMARLLFLVARPSTVIVLSVVPEPLRHSPTADKHPTYPEYLERRSAFYGTDHPGLVTVEEMIPGYRRAVNANGFKLEWYVSVRRTIRSGDYYLALKVKRD